MTRVRAAERLVRLGSRAVHVLVRSTAVLIGLAFLTLAGALLLLSQTVVGRKTVGDLVEGALQGEIRGEVRLGPVIGGNLLTRAHLAHFEIVESDGTPFLSLDSVRIEYNPVSLLLGTYRFRNVIVQRARMEFRQNDDGEWNFDRLFGSADTAKSEGPPGRTRLLLHDVQIRSGTLRVRTPWARNLHGVERDSAVAEGLRGEKLWRVRRLGPDLVERELVLESLRGRFPLIRLIDPSRPMRFELSAVSTTADVVARTLDVRRFDGAAVFRDTIEIAIDRFETPNTLITGNGWVTPGDPEQFSFDLAAERIGFADLRWLPIPVPGDGGGPALLDIRTRGDVVVVRAADGDVRVQDSRVTGGFVIALEETPRFESLDVRFRPVRLALVDELLDRDGLIDGFLRGPVTGAGPVDLVQLDADIELTDDEADGDPSRVRVQGGISIGEPKEMQDLRLDLVSFDPRWTAVIGIRTPLVGRVDGRATFSGHMGGPFEFDSEVLYRQPGASDSRVRGNGRVDLTETRSVDVRFDADPLALPVLEPVMAEYGHEIDLVGDVRGPLTAQGALSDLRVVADLRTPRGLLNFDGRFDLEAVEKSYDARLLARDIELRQWFENGPATRLAVQGRVRGQGTDPATLRASFDLTILRSLVEGAQVDTSLLRFTISEGLARADTFAIRTDAGRIDGQGAFGLARATSGSLILNVEAPNLATWNRWLVAGRNPARQDTSVAVLFEAFEGPEEERVAAEEVTEVRDTLAGSLTGLGVVYGNLHAFSAGGRLLARDMSLGDARLDSLQLTVDVADPRDLEVFSARALAWGVEAPGGRADSLFALWSRQEGGDSRVELFARRDTSVAIETSAALRWDSDSKEAFIERFRAVLGDHDLRLEEPARIRWDEAGLLVRGVALSDAAGGRIELEGVVPDSGQASLDLRMRDLRLESLLQLPLERPRLRGLVELDVSLRGTVDAPRWEGRAEVREPALYGIGFGALAAEASYADRRLDLQSSLRSDERELARVDGYILADLSLREVGRRLLDDPLHLTVTADSLPLELLELRFSALRDVTGYSRGRIEVTGQPGRIRLDGAATVRAAGATVPYLGIRLQDVGGAITFVGEHARIESATIASSAGGSASLAGLVGTAEPTNPSFDLTFRASRLVPMSRRMGRFLLDGDGRLGGTYEAPELTGAFRVSEGSLRAERFVLQKRAVDLTDPDVYALIDTTLVTEERLFRRAQNPFMQNLKADLRLTFGPNLWLRSEALDVEILGDLDVRMDRAQQDIVAFGTLTLPRGKYRYVAGSGSDLSSLYSRNLKIAGGTITFVGTPGVDPNLDIRAEYETRTDLGPVTIAVNVRGTSLNPTMETSSDPPLPEADEVCYLLFSSACVGAGNQGGEFAASLVREGLLGTVSNQFSQVLVSGVGLVDYFDIRSTGYGPTLEAGQTTTNLLYGTEIEIGRYLTPDLFVKATQPIGGQLPGFSAEWAFARSWRLNLLTEDRFKRYASYGYSFSSYSDRTWGLMLFRDWNF